MYKRIAVRVLAALLVLGGGFVAAAPAQAQHDWAKTPAANGLWDPAKAGADVDLIAKLPPYPKIDKATGKVLTTPNYNGKKFAPPSTGPAARFVDIERRVYGLGRETRTNTGGCANVTVGNPYVKTGDSHSLAEISVQDTLASTNDTAEFGWLKGPGGSVQLFGYHFDGGVGQGYGVDWVDNASNPINLGSSITTGVTKQFCLTYDSVQSVWWSFFDTGYVAYIGSASWTGTAFTSAGGYQWFHEYAYLDDQNGNDADGKGDFTCGDLGDGRQGSAGSGNAALFGSVSLQGISSALINLTVTTQGTIHSPAEFTVLKLSNRTFTSGGPGRNSVNTATGTAGAC